MKAFFRHLARRRFPYEPLITIEISKNQLLKNLKDFQSKASQGQVAPVLKSNAYGHGLVEVATFLEDQSEIPFFIVDSYFEAIILRSKGVKKPLLIIGYNRPETIINSRIKDIAFTITSLEMLQSIQDIKRPTKIHLKIDTGMRRQGLLPEDITEAIEIIKKNSYIRLEGICTHFSDADNSNSSFTDQQIRLWNSIVSDFKTQFPSLKYIHAANTDGMKYSKQIEANIGRLGIGLYRGVLQMKTIVTSIKELKKGETIGYGNTYKANADMKVATIPVGYYEGLDRRLSNKGFVQVGPEKILCPIVGRVSMNISSIDVSKVPGVHIGTEVVVISRNITDPNSVEGISKIENTIDYEVLVRIPAHLKRVEK